MTDAREKGRVILAHGEQTGHRHEIVVAETGLPPDVAEVQYFDEPDGTRMLIALETAPALIERHEEHGAILLSREEALAGAQGLRDARGRIRGQYRQGDVLLHPVGLGAWRVCRQSEGYSPEAWRQVAD